MQRRAREAYDTQWLLHTLTGTVPPNVPVPETASTLHQLLRGSYESSNGILPTNASLYDFMRSKGVKLPVMLTAATNGNGHGASSNGGSSSNGGNGCSSANTSKLGDAVGSSNSNSRGSNKSTTTTTAAATTATSAAVAAATSGAHRVTTVFLLDLDGTTTSTLYVRSTREAVIAALAPTVAQRYPQDAAMRELVEAAAAFMPELKAAFALDVQAKHTDETATARVRELFVARVTEAMQQSSRLPYYKQVQSYVWLHLLSAQKPPATHVFRDVNTFLRTMGRPGQLQTRVAIYSTGVTESQRAVFRNTTYGDLTPYIAAYFDHRDVGSKLTPKSYSKIRRLLAERLNVSPDALRIVFVTDSPTELCAAETSSDVECSLLCVRPYNDWITFDTLYAIDVAHICSLEQLIDRASTVDLDALIVDARNFVPLPPSPPQQQQQQS